MSRSNLNMSDVYDLLELHGRIETDGRSVKPEERKHFVELAHRAVQERWGDKVLGGTDVLASIVETHNRISKRLGGNILNLNLAA